MSCITEQKLVSVIPNTSVRKYPTSQAHKIKVWYVQLKKCEVFGNRSVMNFATSISEHPYNYCYKHCYLVLSYLPYIYILTYANMSFNYIFTVIL